MGLSNNEAVKAAKRATIEYVDMCDYWFKLAAIRNDFDKSLEVCRPKLWLKLNMSGDTGDNDIEDARFNLEGASESLHNLMCITEQNCIKQWSGVLGSPIKEVRKYFFGEDIQLEESAVEEILESNLFRLVNNIDYNEAKEQTVEIFVEELKKLLLNNIENSSKKNVDKSKVKMLRVL